MMHLYKWKLKRSRSWDNISMILATLIGLSRAHICLHFELRKAIDFGRVATLFFP